jgi:hypothetical protein
MVKWSRRLSDSAMSQCSLFPDDGQLGGAEEPTYDWFLHSRSSGNEAALDRHIGVPLGAAKIARDFFIHLLGASLTAIGRSG